MRMVLTAGAIALLLAVPAYASGYQLVVDLQKTGTNTYSGTVGGLQATLQLTPSGTSEGTFTLKTVVGTFSGKYALSGSEITLTVQTATGAYAGHLATGATLMFLRAGGMAILQTSFANHGQYVSTVAKIVKALEQAGKLPPDTNPGQIVSGAAHNERELKEAERSHHGK